ncbi:MAG: TPM domain-containing protein [Chitinophagales bacterium]|nr:TPM domain-containing protein [Chitinophagales bacterium]
MTSPFHKILLVFLLVIPTLLPAQPLDDRGIPEAPSPPRLVNDFAGLWSDDKSDLLEQKLVSFNDSTSSQITVVTVESIGDYDISEYAVELGRKWGIGQKDKNNGILILVAKQERKVDIEVGYGLEAYLTDYDSKRIIEELIVPAFKQNNYYKGVDDATDRIIGLITGSYTNDGSKSVADQMPTWLVLLIVFGIFAFIIYQSRKQSAVSMTGRGWRKWDSTPPGGFWGGGGGFSGGGSSGGGFGGFGGGSFGGGGSSGSW